MPHDHKAKSRLLESVHEVAADLHRLGFIDENKMLKYDALCGSAAETEAAGGGALTEQFTPPLIRQFDLLATAPGGVARLRELILTLAVQGKLVPQEAGDEPASVLLQRIRARKIKQDKPLPAISDEEKPFELHETWEWARVGDLVEMLNGYAFKSEWFKPSGTRLLRNVNISHGHIDWSQAAFIDPTLADDFSSFDLKVGDIVLSLDRPIISTGLKYAIIKEHDLPCLLLQRVARLSPYAGGLSASFFELWLQSNSFVGTIDPGRSNGVPHISTKQVANLVIGLPPLAEQSRIVTRVEELMRLCDALEQQRQLETAQHAQLLNTLLGTLTDCTSPDELAANWLRVSDHFDLLLDRPEAVDALEQTILQLAVRGLLVPQHDDEAVDQTAVPSCKNSDLPPINENELPFDAPPTWRWVRLGSVSDLINGDRGTNYPNKSEYVPTGIPFINTGHIEPDGSLSHDSMHFLTRQKFDSLRSGKTQPGDLVYCLRGATLGKTAIVDYQEGAIASSLVIIRLNEQVDRNYAYCYLTGPLGRQLVRRFDNGSAQPNLAAGSVRRYVLPLPPLDEQRRIVARVTQLRHLCTTLRQRLAARQTTQRHLAEALVEI